jgi:formylglycine-generating enzyme required for sulfatase activity
LGKQAFRFANNPRDSVSWYQAVAFCRWLSAKLGYEVRLPTEQEWEKAARGTDGRQYPWGNEYISGYANVDETEENVGPHYLRQTSSVGIYPQGASPFGVPDMSGNVWEWCLNEYENPENTDLVGDAARVLRGGSWGSGVPCARCASRDGGGPSYRSVYIGFRAVCSASMP